MNGEKIYTIFDSEWISKRKCNDYQIRGTKINKKCENVIWKPNIFNKNIYSSNQYLMEMMNTRMK